MKTSGKKPIFGYLMGAIIAWPVLFIDFMVEMFFLQPAQPLDRPLQEAGFIALFALFLYWLPSIVVMSVPWIAVVFGYRRSRIRGSLYFSVMGAVLIFIIGCIVSSLSPKPLFIEDQTFFQGFIIAAERTGVGLFLAGAMFGFVYWIFGEKGTVLERPD